MSKKDILRRGRFTKDPDKAVSDFISSIGQDRRILEADIWVDRAHVLMLNRQKIIPPGDALAILNELDSISTLDWNDLMDGDFDDVHVLLESRIMKTLGEEVGGRLHTGRSRNDEVVACVRITLREDILDVIEGLMDLQGAILDIAARHVETVMPGYTHLQRGQVTTLAHHLIAHSESITRDLERLKSCYERVNVNPLGAGAMCSTSHPIDSDYTSDLLAFGRATRNSMDAVASRDFLLEALCALSVSGVGLSKIAEELVLWSTSEFNYISLSDAYSFTSSIMPQKKNPDVAELSRARISSVIGGLISALSICKDLPLSYNSDLQEATLHLWNAIDIVKAVTLVLRGALSTMKVNEGNMEDAASRGFLWATDLADLLVSERGIPFRAAHSIVADVARNWNDHLDNARISQEVARASESLGLKIQLDEESISRAMNLRNSIQSRNVCGGPAPSVTEITIETSRAEMEGTLKWVGKQRASIDSAKIKVRDLQDELAGRKSGVSDEVP